MLPIITNQKRSRLPSLGLLVREHCFGSFTDALTERSQSRCGLSTAPTPTLISQVRRLASPFSQWPIDKQHTTPGTGNAPRIKENHSPRPARVLGAPGSGTCCHQLERDDAQPPRPGSVSAGMSGWFSHASLARSQGLRLALEGNRPPPFPGKRSRQGWAHRAPGEGAAGEQAGGSSCWSPRTYRTGLCVFCSPWYPRCLDPCPAHSRPQETLTE